MVTQFLLVWTMQTSRGLAWGQALTAQGDEGARGEAWRLPWGRDVKAEEDG